MTDVDREVVDQALTALEDYMKEMTEIVMENDIEEEYGTLLMVNQGEMVQNMTTSEEDIIKFVNNFVDYMNKLKREGDLDPKSQFDSIEEAREFWEDWEDDQNGS